MGEYQVLTNVVQIVGPLGSLAVVSVWWGMSVLDKRRNGNGRTDGTAMKNLSSDITEIKSDVSELRKAFTTHLERHGNR